MEAGSGYVTSPRARSSSPGRLAVVPACSSTHHRSVGERLLGMPAAPPPAASCSEPWDGMRSTAQVCEKSQADYSASGYTPPATRASLCPGWLLPTTGPLHLLFPLPGPLVPQTFPQLAPSTILVSAQISLLQTNQSSLPHLLSGALLYPLTLLFLHYHHLILYRYTFYLYLSSSYLPHQTFSSMRAGTISKSLPNVSPVPDTMSGPSQLCLLTVV